MARVEPRPRSSPSPAATRGRAERYASEHGIERAYDSYEALLADPGHRRRLHLAAQRAAPGVDRAGAARPASTCSARSRSSRRAADVGRRSTWPSARAAAHGGVHVPPPPADRAPGASWSQPARSAALRLVRAAFSFHFDDPRRRAPERRAGRRRADGRRLLLRQRVAAAGRRARAGQRHAGGRRRRRRRHVQRLDAVSRRRARSLRQRADPRPIASTWRSSARRAACSSHDPWHCVDAA